MIGMFTKGQSTLPPRRDDQTWVESQEAIPGMTLRDWFAGQAIRARWGDGTAMCPEEAGMMAYQLADAMLTIRVDTAPEKEG